MKELVVNNLKLEIKNTSSQLLERIVEMIDSVYSDNKTEAIGEEEENLLKVFEHTEQLLLEDNSKTLRTFLRYKKLKKQTTMSLKQFINPATGKIHSRYNALGAATGRLCIAEDQQVLTVNRGLIPIKEVNVGDEVYSLDLYNTLKIKQVSNVWNKGIQKTITLKVINAKTEEISALRCTPDHLLRTLKGTWVSVESLYQGIWLIGACKSNEGFITVSEYVVESLEETEDITVYDIEVDDYHNFFASNLCCHNSSSGPNVQQISARLYTTIEADVTNLNQYNSSK
jgi:intein/homing endonuclease